MRILITNDDGIHAPGLEACEKIARKLSDEIWIVAPESDQSGVSHSLSLNDPLRLREVAERHFAVKGTPTDCVIMGARHLMKEMPDLVLSGVNRGRNAAEDVTYSGTVAGAMEGTVLGIPSFSLSQAYAVSTRHTPHWETAIKFAPDLIRRVLKTGMPRDVLVNVNFPDCPPDKSPASPSSPKANATRSCCASTRATTGAAIRITGSPSAAAALPERRPAAISPRSTTSASRSRRCGST
jgi:5''/3''-nucleotidase SurE